MQAYDYGGAYCVMRLFDELGWEKPIRACWGHRRTRFDLVCNIRVLVANRLLDPSSKLHILEWFKGVWVPGVDRRQVSYAHLLRAMDFLWRHKKSLEVGFAQKLVSLFELEVDLVFYDVTSVYFEIDGADPEAEALVSTLRQHGYSGDHRPELPQVVIGLVMTREGIPLAHHVFAGNTVDKKTLREVVRDLKERFGIRRAIFVGDRGMLSEENLETLREAGLDYIVAHPLRGNNTVKEVLGELEPALERLRARELSRAEKAHEEPGEVVAELVRGGRRLVVAHQETIARQARKSREEKLQEAQRFIRKLHTKLLEQDLGFTQRGRALSDQGALLQIHDYLRDRKLLRYVEVGLDEKGALSWEPKTEARRWEKRIDGKLVLESSVKQLSAQQIVERYKELADIERAFRTMKSALDLRPLFHRADRRIQAHVFLCVMALQIDRVMRYRLRAAGIQRLPTRALQALDRFRLIRSELSPDKNHLALTTPSSDQLELFKALAVPRPSLPGQEPGQSPAEKGL